jgi:hypothetical protein
MKGIGVEAERRLDVLSLAFRPRMWDTGKVNGVHLLRSGDWVDCDETSCATELHMDISITDAKQLPRPMLERLLAPFDSEPTMRYHENSYINRRTLRFTPRRSLVTEWWNEHDELHRDFGLPARVWDTGVVEYWEHGEFRFAVGRDPEADGRA